MSEYNQEICKGISKTEAEIDHLEQIVSIVVCTALPMALVIYTILF
jgi:hypothetical protein